MQFKNYVIKQRTDLKLDLKKKKRLDFKSDETYKDHTCESTGTDLSGLSGGVVTKPDTHNG